jgi:hypothetical protein
MKPGINVTPSIFINGRGVSRKNYENIQSGRAYYTPLFGTVFNAASTFAFNFVYLLRFDPITRAAPIITNNGASHGIPKSATR